jgi:arabinofuranosyltransferase
MTTFYKRSEVINKMRKLPIILASIISVVFIVYGFDCIWGQSFIAIDGNRYFTIADDALITLRYGWNLSHGNGLVWNPGEYVEGTTSLLWALHSAILALFFNKRLLPCAIQLSSIVFLLSTSFTFRSIFRHCNNKSAEDIYSVLLEIIAFLTPLSYFFFIAWSLKGMETSLQGFLIALAVYLFIKNKTKCSIVGSAILGLCYLARPDSVVLAADIFIFRGFLILRKKILPRQLLIEMLPFVLFLLGITMFRYTYYGSFVPNTYTLKVTGMTVFERITLNGIGYIIPFILITWPVLVAVLISILFRPTFVKSMLAFLPLSMIAYVVYIGGDAFHDWRFIAPYMPYVFLVLLLDWSYLNSKYLPVIKDNFVKIAAYYLLTMLTAILYFTIGRPPYLYFTLSFKNPQQDNVANINTAIYLNRILKNDASVGVFYAGAIPFYTGFKAYDFLGKSDPYIASLPPDMSGEMSGREMRSMPGHNKYDLKYSILKKLPTFVDGLKHGRQDITKEALKYYTPVSVKFETWTSFNMNTILLLRESQSVRWDKINGADKVYELSEKQKKAINYSRTKMNSGLSDEIILNEFAQKIVLKTNIGNLQVSEKNKILVEIKNTSTHVWPGGYAAKSVRLSYHWLNRSGKIIVYDGERTLMPQDLAPGQSIILNALIKTPDVPGEYILQLTMLREFVAWFENRGAKPLNVHVVVKGK